MNDFSGRRRLNAYKWEEWKKLNGSNIRHAVMHDLLKLFEGKDYSSRVHKHKWIVKNNCDNNLNIEREEHLK